MNSSQLSREELIKEIHRLNYNVGRRVKRIDKALQSVNSQFIVDVLSTTKETYEKIDKSLLKNINTLKTKDMRSVYRQLKGIDTSKLSSTRYVKRQIKELAKSQQRADEYSVIGKTIEAWDNWGRKNRDKYNTLIARMKEHYSGIYDKYKYDIQEYITDKVNARINIDKITTDLIDIIDAKYELERLSELNSTLL